MLRKLFLAGILPVVTCAWASADDALPDLMTMRNDKKVATVDEWEKIRRPELLELFRENIYGQNAAAQPATLTFKVEKTIEGALGGTARGMQIAAQFGNSDGRKGEFHISLFMPIKRSGPAHSPVPAMILANNRPKRLIDINREKPNEFWPAEAIVARGYAAVAYYVSELSPDRKEEQFKTGVPAVFESAGQPRAANAWGAIGIWAWGASRVMDYLETNPDIDAKHVAIVGHSRGGKTALWAGAQDTRFAMVVSNCSGSTGAALARGKPKTAESILAINTTFPYWFCDHYKKFNDKENELPVDQHELLALIAPRLLYVASKTEDAWADPQSEFAACVAARPAWELYGKPGIIGDQFPAPEKPLMLGMAAYHISTGKHDLTLWDWQRFMDFADQHGMRGPVKKTE